MRRLGLLAIGCGLIATAAAAAVTPAVSYTLSAIESDSTAPVPSPAPVLMPRSALTCDPIPLSAADDSWRIQHQSFVDLVQHEPVEGSEQPSSSWLFRGGSVTDDNFRHDGLGAAAVTNHGSVLPEEYQSRFLHTQLLASLRALAAKTLGSNDSSSSSAHSASSSGSVGFPASDSDIYLIDINLMWPDRDDDLSRITAEYRWFTLHDGADPSVASFQLQAGEFHSWPVHGTANNISVEYEDEPEAHTRARSRHGGSSQQHRVSRNAELRESLLSGRRPRGYEAPDSLRTRLDHIESMLMHKHREVYQRDLRAYELWMQKQMQKRRDSRSRSDSNAGSGAGPDADAVSELLPSPPSKRTIVIYIHCFCGTDRTGELMGSWALSRQSRSFAEVNARNAEIGDRPMACRNYRAMQLWCLEVQGQRPQKDLGCEQNHPCTMFV